MAELSNEGEPQTDIDKTHIDFEGAIERVKKGDTLAGLEACMKAGYGFIQHIEHNKRHDNPNAPYALRRIINDEASGVISYVLFPTEHETRVDPKTIILQSRKGEPELEKALVRFLDPAYHPYDKVDENTGAWLSDSLDPSSDVERLDMIKTLYNNGNPQIAIDPTVVTVINKKGEYPVGGRDFSMHLRESTSQELRTQYESMQRERELRADQRMYQKVTDAVEQVFSKYLADVPATAEDFTTQPAIIDGFSIILANRDSDFAPLTVSADQKSTITDGIVDLKLHRRAFRRALRAVDDYVREQEQQGSTLPAIDTKTLYTFLNEQYSLAEKRYEQLGAIKSFEYKPERREAPDLLRSDEEVSRAMQERGFHKLAPWTGEIPDNKKPYVSYDEEAVIYSITNEEAKSTSILRRFQFGKSEPEKFPEKYVIVIRKKDEPAALHVYTSSDGGDLFVHGRGDSVKSIHSNAPKDMEITGLHVQNLFINDRVLKLEDSEVIELSLSRHAILEANKSTITRLLSGNNTIDAKSTIIDTNVAEAYFANATLVSTDTEFASLTVDNGATCTIDGDVTTLNVSSQKSIAVSIDGRCDDITTAKGQGIVATISEDCPNVHREGEESVAVGKALRRGQAK